MTFTAQEKKDLRPLQGRVEEWNAALGSVSKDCVCWELFRDTDALDNLGGCPAAPLHCMGVTVIAVRVAMNLLRMPNQHLSNADLLLAVWALGDLFAGLEVATSRVRFAKQILSALNDPAAAQLVRRCRKCGCTDNQACQPVACFWVAGDLCSACLPAPVGVRS